MSDLNTAIRSCARDLLAEGRVDYVLGYETGGDGVNARPCFAYAPDETERLVFDNTCTHNLVKYLTEPHRRQHRIGVVVKPCDARALAVLRVETQVPPNVVTIGVACPGVVRRTRDGGDGTTLQERCLACEQHAPSACDILVGEAPGESPAADPFQRLAPVAALSASERAEYWSEQFSRCIRCYACRQVCPLCYCSECFAESLDPEWVGIRIGETESWLYHTIRAFHLAGRCIGCDECERVCPVNIPLGMLSGRLRQEVGDAFGYRAGTVPDQPPPLETFKKDDRIGDRP